MKYEPFQTPQRIAEMSGFPVRSIREWCSRADNPLPHVTTGTDRKLTHIRWSEFVAWIEKEQRKVAVD